jgi:hypothetical protein
MPLAVAWSRNEAMTDHGVALAAAAAATIDSKQAFASGNAATSNLPQIAGPHRRHARAAVPLSPSFTRN